jgi:hypothetical protein
VLHKWSNDEKAIIEVSHGGDRCGFDHHVVDGFFGVTKTKFIEKYYYTTLLLLF